MKRFKVILLGLLLVVAGLPAGAGTGRYAISTEQIAATVSRYGIEIAPDHVRLLSGVMATTAAPRLTVRSINSWGNERLMARLECASREECLPFFVGLEIARDSGAGAPVRSTTEEGTGPQSSATPARKDNVLRKGSPATLQLDGERVHIRISVICLENGAPGQVIRVTGKDHRLVYTAKVLDGSLLQGRL